MATGGVRSQHDYLQKTAKLIPAEALALYIAISGQVKAYDADTVASQWITFGAATFVCFVIVPFILYKLQRVRSFAHYAISMFAFALWVFNAQYERLPQLPISGMDSMAVAIGSIVLLIFTFMAPFLLPTKS